MVKVQEANRGHDTKIDVHERQTAQEYVRSGRLFAVVDEDGNDEHIGRDSHDHVDALQGEVKEDSLHQLLAPVEHTEGFYCGIDGGI